MEKLSLAIKDLYKKTYLCSKRIFSKILLIIIIIQNIDIR